VIDVYIKLMSLLVLWLLAWTAAPACTDEGDALAAAARFLAVAAPASVAEDAEVSGPSDDVHERPVYTVYYPAVHLPHGQVAQAIFEVHAGRSYVCTYVLSIPGQRAVLADATVTQDEALRIARELVATCFPNWGDELEFGWVKRPNQGGGGVAEFVCGWQGRRHGIRTGDWVAVFIEGNGQVRDYMCNAGVVHGQESARILQQRALAVAQAFIGRHATFSMDEVTFTADLVLSHPQAPDEGPVWQVMARRPPPAEGWQERVLQLFVDAVNGRAMQSALAESFGQSRYFYSDW